MDNNNWDENTLNWKNAPNLEGKQVRITDVGGTAHVAGEIVVDETVAYYQLDVTELLRNCREQEITFVLIRRSDNWVMILIMAKVVLLVRKNLKMGQNWLFGSMKCGFV